MEMISIFNEFAHAAAPAAVTALWQGTALAIGLTVCLGAATRIAAADRFRAWAAGFAALVALPFIPFLKAILFSAHPGSAASGVVPATRAWIDVDPRWALVIAGLWVAGSIWRAADLTTHALRLRKVWKAAEPIEFDGAGVEVCSTRELDRPSVIGFFRPRILIPEWLLDRLSDAELRQVILHEAEHLRRRDDWTNLLQKLALVVFPLNPGLAWIERRLCHEREMACDDAVVRATGKPRAYATCLTSLAERGLERKREALALGAWRMRPELVGRVHRLLKQAPGLSPAATRALLAVIVGGLAVGSVEFARAPQLVAFVAPVISQSSTPDLVNAGGRRMAGFRAVNAMAVAHVAGPLESTATKRDLQPGRTATTEKRRGESVRTRSVNATEDAPRLFEVATSREGRANDGQQWIVLTTWEQVVAERRSSRRTADYEIDEAAPTAAHSSDQATGQLRVSQFILRVDPVRTDFDAAPWGDTPDANSQPDQPMAIPPQPPGMPVHGGWLIFQL